MGFGRKNLPVYVFSIIYAAILVYVFWPLISLNEILPGNDTLGHFWAFREFFQSLSLGHFWSYSIHWFSGMPLFQFYAPLGFLLMSGFFAVFGHFISQFLVFRWYVFLSFAVFPLPFYLFVKAYAGKVAARFSLPLSLLLIFYPSYLNFMGLGAASAVMAGLFDEMFAIDILLLYLVALKKLIDSDSLNWKWIAWSGIALTLVFLSHTLTSIIAGVLTLLLGVFYVRRWFKWKLFYNLAAVVLLGVLLSSFWLFPFIANLRFTSAERIDTKAFLSSPLTAFAPFNLSDLWHGGALTFSYAWLAAVILFVIGLVFLLKHKQAVLPYLFFVIFFVFGLDYFNGVFSTLPLHYYRVLGYDLIFFLAVAACGAAFLWGRYARRRVIVAAFSVIGLLVLVQCVYFFNFQLTTNNGGMVSSLPSAIAAPGADYGWRLTQYAGFWQANSIVADLKSAASTTAPLRIMPDMSPPSLLSGLSSIHFFNTALPLANGQTSLFGLYAESAWQLPFIFPTTNPITGDNMVWGRVRDLAYDGYFNSQPLEDLVKRLQLFGINYLITGSSFFDQQAQRIKEATLVKSDGAFKLYSLSGARPLISAARYAPGLFVSAGGRLDFREFALGWYSVPDLLDYPVADWTKGADDLTASSSAPFSFIAVETDGSPNARVVNQILSLGKPVVFLNEASSSLGLAAPSNVWEIDDFQPVALPTNDSATMVQPDINGLNALSKFIHKFALSNVVASATPVISAFADENIAFSGTGGPVIVNLGYFPYWQCASGCDAVYPVTPGQMLVFASGSTALVYRPGTDAEVGEWLSVAGILLLIGSIYLSLRSKSKNLGGSTS